MPRRRYPYTRYFADPNEVPEGWKRDFAVWLRALAIRHGDLAPETIIAEAISDSSCPINWLLTQPTPVLVTKARKVILRERIRLLLAAAVRGPLRGQKFRFLVSVMLNGFRQYVPPSFIAQNPTLLREVTTRAATFRDSWERHRVNHVTLGGLPRNLVWWR